MTKSKSDHEKESNVQVTVSGAGVVHVESSTLIKTKRAQRQIKALGKLKEKKIINTE